MTKKNILTAIAAVAMSATILSSGVCFNASASTADGTTDPNFVPRYESELELAPPIRLMTDEEIPVQAYDAIFEVMDQNDDGAVRVADAIQAKKEGNDELSKVICNYIVNDGYAEDLTACAVSLQMINDYIRSDQFQLISVWKDDISDGEPYMAHFMFLNAVTGRFFVYETNFITDEQGFINFWDIDDDQSVTEKDAAQVYLDSEDELKALSISAYAQEGWNAFTIISDRSSKPARDLERLIARDYELIGVDGGDLTVFSYSEGIMNLLW